jgi:hypothetical protein
LHSAGVQLNRALWRQRTCRVRVAISPSLCRTTCISLRLLPLQSSARSRSVSYSHLATSLFVPPCSLFDPAFCCTLPLSQRSGSRRCNSRASHLTVGFGNPSPRHSTDSRAAGGCAHFLENLSPPFPLSCKSQALLSAIPTPFVRQSLSAQFRLPSSPPESEPAIPGQGFSTPPNPFRVWQTPSRATAVGGFGAPSPARARSDLVA